MARPMWSGSISFGLVNIPVKLYTAVRNTDISFHMLSEDGKCRLRRKLVCPDTGKEYDYSETTLGYEVAPDQYVVMKRDELNKLRPESGDTIDILDFVKLEEIDPIYFDRAYYLGPAEKGTKAYRLLYSAMKDSGRIAVAKFVMREHEYLAALRVYNGILALETMHFAEEVENSEELGEPVKDVHVEKRELQLATQLIDSLTGKFRPEKYHNEYQEKLREILEAKSEGREIVTHAAAAKPGKVIDIMDALKKSLQERAGESGGKKTSAKKQQKQSKAREPKPTEHKPKKRATR